MSNLRNITAVRSYHTKSDMDVQASGLIEKYARRRQYVIIPRRFQQKVFATKRARLVDVRQQCDKIRTGVSHVQQKNFP